jgi:hypothetical protein
LARDVYAAGEHALLRPRVRRLTRMIEAVGASSVYRYLASQPLAPRDVLKNTSCPRAAADVSHADEQDTDHARDSKTRSRVFQVALGVVAEAGFAR